MEIFIAGDILNPGVHALNLFHSSKADFGFQDMSWWLILPQGE